MTVLGFLDLYHELEQSNTDPAQLIDRYLSDSADTDLNVCLCLLSNFKGYQLFTATELLQLAGKFTGLPDWLVSLSHKRVNDACETAALLTHQKTATSNNPNLTKWLIEIEKLQSRSFSDREHFLFKRWNLYPDHLRLFLNRIITKQFKANCEPAMVARYLQKRYGLTYRFSLLIRDKLVKPLKYGLTSLVRQFEGINRALKSIDSPIVKYKLKLQSKRTQTVFPFRFGLIVQIACFRGSVFVWNQKEEEISRHFPEFQLLRGYLQSDLVLVGELVCSNECSAQQNRSRQAERLSKTDVTKADLKKGTFALSLFQAFDLVESGSTKKSKSQDQLIALAERSKGLLLYPEVSAQDRQPAGKRILRESALLSISGRNQRSPLFTVHYNKSIEIIASLLYLELIVQNSRSAYQFTLGVQSKDKIIAVHRAMPELPVDQLNRIKVFVKAHKIARYGPVTHIAEGIYFKLTTPLIYHYGRTASEIKLHEPIELQLLEADDQIKLSTIEQLQSYAQAN